MTAETKSFPVNVLLTVTTGRLLTTSDEPNDNGIGQLYDILNWMTEDNLFTRQLPRASNECKPWLFRWFPELACVSIPSLDRWIKSDQTKGKTEFLKFWLAEQKMLIPDLKDSYEVPRMPRDDHDAKDPVEELVAMIGADKVIVVAPEEEPDPSLN